MVRIIIVLLIVGASIVAVEIKKQKVSTSRAKEASTILSELQNKGAAVVVGEVARSDFEMRKTVSLKPCERLYCFSVSSNEITRLKTGSNLYDSSGNEKIGRIVGVATSPSLLTGLYEVTARLNTKPSHRGPVLADVSIGKKRNVLQIPPSAVVFSEGQSQVYVVDAIGKVKITNIKLGEFNGSSYVVNEGIRGGEKIVIDGKTLVARFGKINIIEGES
jgi:hypothetical protein